MYVQTASTVQLQRSSAVRTILLAGLIAGLLDGLDAAIVISRMHHVSADRIFQFIASGLLGRAAFGGGWPAALLGVICHFVIATSAAAAYYVASRKVPLLLRRPLLSGPLFGLCVFLAMQYVVVPLSATPRGGGQTLPALVNLLISHIFFVGIPIALVVSRAGRARLS
jgi:hypothetical protein